MSNPTTPESLGFRRVVAHLGGLLTLSEIESQRVLTEFTNAILMGCCLEDCVNIPRFGKFKFDKANLTFVANPIAHRFAATLVDKSRASSFATEPKPTRVLNHQDPMRDSLVEYLKYNYPSELDWTTPLGKVYTYTQVQEATSKIRKLNDDYYDIFISRLITTRRRDIVANAFLYSEATIKRRCDAVIASILLLLIHPELASDSVARLYRH